MKRSAVLLCLLTLVVASVPERSRAFQLTDDCASTAAEEFVRLKACALDDLRSLRDDIANDPLLGVLSDPFLDLSAAIESFEASLELIRDKDPDTITAAEVQAVVEALESEEVGIESLIDTTSEDFGDDQFLPEAYVLRAEDALRMTLAGDEAFVLALLARVAGALSSGSDSDSIDPDAALADAQALQDECTLPRSPVTRETDGTCDDVPGAYSDLFATIIVFI
jgi:hypothetical protein